MSSLVESNRLSLSNYLETLAIIAFLSFAIGLYWRFKFRSKYLAMELEELRQLNKPNTKRPSRCRKVCHRSASSPKGLKIAIASKMKAVLMNRMLMVSL